MQNLTKYLANSVRMENTRILYTGIEKLCEKYSQRFSEPLTSHNDWVDFIKEEIDACLISTDNSKREYLAHNPESDFFKFFLLQYGDESTIAYMVNLFWQTDETSNILCEYELCNCVRGIMNCDVCYLVYHRASRVRLLANSDIRKSVFDDDSLLLRELDFKILIREPPKAPPLDVSQITFIDSETIQIQKHIRPERTTEVNLIQLKFDLGDSEAVSIFCQMPETPIEKDWSLNGTGNRVRNVLFLRNRFVHYFRKQLSTILDSRRNNENILPLTPSRRVVLHITDLHIEKSQKDEVLRALKTEHLSGKAGWIEYMVDVIAITGDVISGRHSAGEMEENYECAEEIIRQLAKDVWETGDNKDFVRGDWRKRIMIIPGNHDYASMNELESISDNSSRVTIAGKPAQKEGSVMAKFSYYIDFVRRLLDADISKLIDQRLNETRSYKKLGLRFMCLNTDGGSNAMRNNKMQIDAHFNKIYHSAKPSHAVGICLAHHSPLYYPDYVADKYWVSPDLPANSPPECDVVREAIEQFKRVFLINSSTSEVPQQDAISTLIEYLDSNHFPKTSPIYSDITYYSAHYQESTNEYCQNMKSSIVNDVTMGEHDRTQYLTELGYLFKKEKISFMLCGHRHEKIKDTEDCCFENDRFFRSVPIASEKPTCQLSYGILVMQDTPSSKHYFFYPEDQCPTECLDSSAPMFEKYRFPKS